MERERGDEIPYGEPMRIPENMDSADMPAGPTDDEVRAWCERQYELIEDLGDFLECYVDPNWVIHGMDAEDTWSHYRRLDPRTLADALALYLKENT